MAWRIRRQTAESLESMDIVPITADTAYTDVSVEQLQGVVSRV